MLSTSVVRMENCSILFLKSSVKISQLSPLFSSFLVCLGSLAIILFFRGGISIDNKIQKQCNIQMYESMILIFIFRPFQLNLSQHIYSQQNFYSINKDNISCFVFVTKQETIYQFIFIIFVKNINNNINYMPTQFQLKITPRESVMGILNGMIGSLLFFLPYRSLEGGYITTLIAIVITGIFCYSSCYFYLQHIGDEPDLGFVFMKHFKNKKIFKFLYNFSSWLFLALVCIQYFLLIVNQCKQLFPFQNSLPIFINPLINAVLLIAFVITLKFLEWNAKTMVYGIFTTIVYLMFLIWVLSTGNQGDTSQEYTAISINSISLAAAMGQGYMIQMFLVPFLRTLDQPNKSEYLSNVYSRYTFYSFVIGCAIYLYIAYVGSFGILHRSIYHQNELPSILAYFNDSWATIFISIVFIVHLYTVYPEFLLISKNLFFLATEDLFNFHQTYRWDISKPQIIYVMVITLIGFLVSILDLPTQFLMVIMIINGGILGYFIIYLFPCLLHLYCMFFLPQEVRSPFPQSQTNSSKSQYIQQMTNQEGTKIRRQSEIQITSYKQQTTFINKTTLIKASIIKEPIYSQKSISQSSLTNSLIRVQKCFVECNCNHYKLNFKAKIGLLIYIIIMMLYGLFLMAIVIRDQVERKN